MSQMETLAHVQFNRTIKCVVWDLDNTLWDGVLLEDDELALRAKTVEVIKVLDSRGILNSIASKGDHKSAMNMLERFGLREYFLYPQINWNSKVMSIRGIAKSINIALDTVAFVDDQAFERDEVAFHIPEVMCLDSAGIHAIPAMPEMNPRFITNDSRVRRQMYLSDIARKQHEEAFEGSSEEFLASLNMEFTISQANEDDLRRAEELTVRTHQLNTTGYTYSYDELNAFRKSHTHKIFVSSLHDRYGPYGKIGLALLECRDDVWTIKLLLMSCRVMSRGVGSVMLNYIMNLAKQTGACLRAEYVANGRNRMMYVTYKFSGFEEIERTQDLIVLENDLSRIQSYPHYITVHMEE